ncbi:MAG: SDR family NAD(P)-dependent oxidoreductase, partial [Deltaproteobacteria bacterium]|nr:SDR family NAD(P)-dependent oxidoreductase [Deltaproteobacteria bacterium]
MELKYENVLVTGAAGFIGFHLAKRLLNDGHQVAGLDNMNPYYDVSLKEARLEDLKKEANFTFFQADLCDRPKLEDLFARQAFEVVVNLAAQAGVRYSLENPHAYVDSNLVGFVNLLECCRHQALNHLVFASSSSV